LILSFLKFYWRAKTRYNTHSPFVFEFVENVLEDDRDYYAFSDIEVLRNALLENNNKIRVADYGAGSRTENGEDRVISKIAKSAL
jgi:hypothetical protein